MKKKKYNKSQGLINYKECWREGQIRNVEGKDRVESSKRRNDGNMKEDRGVKSNKTEEKQIKQEANHTGR